MSSLTVLDKRKCGQACKAYENIIHAKIDLTPERYVELLALRDEVQEQEETPTLRVIAVNVDEDVQGLLEHHHSVSEVTCVTLAAGDWRKALTSCGSKAATDAVVVQTSADDCAGVRELVKACMALSFVSGRPVVWIAGEPGKDADPLPEEYSAAVWRMVSSAGELCKVLESQLPREAALRAALSADIAKLVSRHRHVNAWAHGLSRGAVAFVPFAVHVMNAADILRVTRSLLADTGMVSTRTVTRAVAARGASVGAKLTLVESTSDVYQVAVAGSLMASLGGVAAAQGVAAALATVDVVDAMLLGSISVVTGAISATAAAFARPALVDSLARLLAAMQNAYLANPALRRTVEDAEADVDASVCDKQVDLVEMVDVHVSAVPIDEGDGTGGKHSGRPGMARALSNMFERVRKPQRGDPGAVDEPVDGEVDTYGGALLPRSQSDLGPLRTRLAAAALPAPGDGDGHV